MIEAEIVVAASQGMPAATTCLRRQGINSLLELPEGMWMALWTL